MGKTLVASLSDPPSRGQAQWLPERPIQCSSVVMSKDTLTPAASTALRWADSDRWTVYALSKLRNGITRRVAVTGRAKPNNPGRLRASLVWKAIS